MDQWIRECFFTFNGDVKVKNGMEEAMDMGVCETNKFWLVVNGIECDIGNVIFEVYLFIYSFFSITAFHEK